jgi:signal transduction histidine kinase
VAPYVRSTPSLVRPRSLRWRVNVAVFVMSAIIIVQAGVTTFIVGAAVRPSQLGAFASLWPLLTFVVIVAWTLLVANWMARWIQRPITDLLTVVEDGKALLSVRESTELGVDGDVGALLNVVARAWRRDHQALHGKIAFVAALVHDLKTQVTGVRLLLDANAHGSSVPELENRIKEELDRLQEWLSKALTALRVDAIEEFIHRADVSVGELCHDIVRSLHVEETHEGLSVSIDGDARAYVDGTEMRRALTNLVANAVRAARTSVTVDVYPGLVRIADDGAGLPAAFPLLSEPFHRVETASALTTSGTGLGLFIARRILELHGGKLVCERSDARGTVFLAFLGREAA